MNRERAFKLQKSRERYPVDNEIRTQRNEAIKAIKWREKDHPELAEVEKNINVAYDSLLFGEEWEVQPRPIAEKKRTGFIEIYTEVFDTPEEYIDTVYRQLTRAEYSPDQIWLGREYPTTQEEHEVDYAEALKFVLETIPKNVKISRMNLEDLKEKNARATIKMLYKLGALIAMNPEDYQGSRIDFFKEEGTGLFTAKITLLPKENMNSFSFLGKTVLSIPTLQEGQVILVRE